MTTAYSISLLILSGTVLGIAVWVLAKLGKALITIAETLVTAVLIYGGLAATPRGLGADLAPAAATATPLAALRHTATDGEVSA